MRLITGWLNGSCQMPFAVPMVWREPKEHSSDGYFCSTNMTEITSKSKHTVQYPHFLSEMRSVPHSEGLLVPKPPNRTCSDDNSDSGDYQEVDNVDCYPAFVASCSSFEPHLLTQQGLNDLVRDLILFKKQVDPLGSRLAWWNLFHQNPEMLLVCFGIAKVNSKNFSVKKTIWYFVMMFSLL